MEHAFLDYSEGARLVVEYCEQLADRLELDLRKSPYWVSPISTASLKTATYDLIIDAEPGSVKVAFTRKQLEDYPAVDKAGVEQLLLSSLNTL